MEAGAGGRNAAHHTGGRHLFLVSLVSSCCTLAALFSSELADSKGNQISDSGVGVVQNSLWRTRLALTEGTSEPATGSPDRSFAHANSTQYCRPGKALLSSWPLCLKSGTPSRGKR